MNEIYKYNPLTGEMDMVNDPEDPGSVVLHQGMQVGGVLGVRDQSTNINTINAYGVCSTAAGTAAKVVTISTGSISALTAGLKISVKFSAANTASNPTLAVNGLAAKHICVNGVEITNTDNKGLLCGLCEFVYDGSYWHLIGNHLTGGIVDVSPVIEAALCSLNASIEALNPENKGELHCTTLNMDNLPKVCGYPLIYFGADAPNRTPDFIGQFYMSGFYYGDDGVLVASGSSIHVYIAIGVTNASSYVRLNN